MLLSDEHYVYIYLYTSTTRLTPATRKRLMTNVTSFSTASIIDRIYNEAYSLLIESRNYMVYALPAVKKDLSAEDRLEVTFQSTRLTSRVLEMISWLLAQKAVQSGEMSREESKNQGFSITNDDVCRYSEGEQSAALPLGLKQLLERSANLYARLARLDGMALAEAA
jgi:regulator of CtrA degradation